MKRSRAARQLVEVTTLAPRPDRTPAAHIGWIAGVSRRGLPLVDFPGNSEGPLEATSTVAAGRADLEAAAGRRQPVVLLFEGGDPLRPIVMGFMVTSPPAAEPRALAEVRAAPGPGLPDIAQVDGKRVRIEGKDEVVLVCGEASITLRRDGKVVLRGTYLDSRSKGTNRIRGGSVQIN